MTQNELISENLPALLDLVLLRLQSILDKEGLGKAQRVVTITVADTMAKGQLQYIANGTRRDMANVFRSLLTKWEEEGIVGEDIPFHRQAKANED